MHLSKTSNALPITHCIAQRAFDYHKRSSVLRVTTSDWKVFLLQAPYEYYMYCTHILIIATHQQVGDRDATVDVSH